MDLPNHFLLFVHGSDILRGLIVAFSKFQSFLSYLLKNWEYIVNYLVLWRQFEAKNPNRYLKIFVFAQFIYGSRNQVQTLKTIWTDQLSKKESSAEIYLHEYFRFHKYKYLNIFL